MLLVQRGHIELKEFQMTQRGHVWGPSEVFIVVYWRRVEKAMAPHSSTLATSCEGLTHWKDSDAGRD